MSYFNFSFNMNYMYGGNMFGGGCCCRSFFPVMNPFMMGAVNGYNSSMNNFFMMSLFNPMFSQPVYSVPQTVYNYPSYNNNNIFPTLTAPAYNPEPVNIQSSAYSESSSKWNEAFSSLMRKLTAPSSASASTSTSTSTSTSASSSVHSSASTSVSASSVQSSGSLTSRSTKNTVSSVSTSSSAGSQNLKRNFSPEFINRVKDIAQKLNCDWQDLMGVMQAESGINPQQWNKGRTAVGLIQFTDLSVAELNQKCGLNLTKEKIAQMSDMQQLDLVEKYLTIAKSYRFPSSARLSSGDLYAIVFLPGRADRDVLTRSGEGYYHSNPIDENHDGIISKSDLAARVAKKRLEVFC